ncbi:MULTISPECIES: ribbon-helix-helix domain-containing protein [Cellulosimicrobium]|uniref:ribbon-helix-helix domain-containing protein n=1 Tax=Cellulosimicrobium TaxID=157920 RepID=UPI0004E2ED6A|nr:ribbon-helix-helix domain-containing protein [Cellulosimicrobium cellulans]KFD43961.1 hypothetical protein IU11_06535 [Cellulosimicrobium sp. MM]QUC01920.1 CopG family transcriptional regulator [Cellulosimicrobium cellulans]
MTMTEKKYDDLAAWAESDAPTIRPGAVVRRGTTASRDAVRALLDDAAEGARDVALVERSAGRPSLDATPGESPMWKVRAPKQLDDQVRAVAAAEGRSVSEVLRAAASEYLNRHAS